MDDRQRGLDVGGARGSGSGARGFGLAGGAGGSVPPAPAVGAADSGLRLEAWPALGRGGRELAAWRRLRGLEPAGLGPPDRRPEPARRFRVPQ